MKHIHTFETGICEWSSHANLVYFLEDNMYYFTTELNKENIDKIDCKLMYIDLNNLDIKEI